MSHSSNLPVTVKWILAIIFIFGLSGIIASFFSNDPDAPVVATVCFGTVFILPVMLILWLVGRSSGQSAQDSRQFSDAPLPTTTQLSSQSEEIKKEKSPEQAKSKPESVGTQKQEKIQAETDRDGVIFDRKMKKGQASYELYSAEDAETAKEFLLAKTVSQGLFYIEVKTPDGTWGVDKDGMYLVELRSWQKDLSLAKCEGQISQWPTVNASMMASQGLMDNALAMVSCGQCKFEWWDGIQPNKATVVRCPQCKTYNQIGGKIHIVNVGETGKVAQKKKTESQPAPKAKVVEPERKPVEEPEPVEEKPKTNPYQPGQREPEEFARYIVGLVKQKSENKLHKIVVLIGFESYANVKDVLDQVADIGLHTDDIKAGPQFGDRNPLIELRYDDAVDQNLVETDARALKGWGATDISAVGISEETLKEFHYWYGEESCPFLVAIKE